MAMYFSADIFHFFSDTVSGIVRLSFYVLIGSGLLFIPHQSAQACDAANPPLCCKLSINAHIDFQSAGWLVVFSFAGVECVRFPYGTRELAKPTMGTRTIAVLVTIAFSVIGVLGDYFLKLASAREQPLRTGWFYLGFALYASTAFGWVFVMKHLKLATISVLYSVSLVLLLTAIGVVLFRESLNYFEVIGIVLAVVALVLLMRFA